MSLKEQTASFAPIDWARRHRIGRPQVLRAAITVVILATVFTFWHQLGIDRLHEMAKAMPAAPVIILLCVLPLLGFPVSWLHLIAGFRFGFGAGLGVVAIATLTHHLLAWSVVQLNPKLVQGRLDGWREKFKGGGHRDVTLLCCLLPGMPYVVQIYLLPAIGVPLAMLLSLSAGLHTFRSIITIYFGTISDELTPGKIALLVCYYALLGGISAWTARRLQKRMRKE